MILISINWILFSSTCVHCCLETPLRHLLAIWYVGISYQWNIWCVPQRLPITCNIIRTSIEIKNVRMSKNANMQIRKEWLCGWNHKCAILHCLEFLLSFIQIQNCQLLFHHQHHHHHHDHVFRMCSFLLVLLPLHPVLPSTHWVVTENGKIQAQVWLKLSIS